MKSKLNLDFSNTEIAFTHKSSADLKETYRMFQLMNNPRLVSLMSSLGLMAVKMRLPFHESMIKRTMFKIFCGGTSLLDSQKAIDLLGNNGVLTVLDYGAEGKSEDEDLDLVMEEVLKGIRFAASNNTVPVVSTKMTALSANELLEKLQKGETLLPAEENSKAKLLSRLQKIGELAEELQVKVFMDAEETWMQDAIDDLVRDMMQEYNKKVVTIYGTFQMYRKDSFTRLQQEFELAEENGYLLGAKNVRGAYMEKERNRAIEEGRDSPIHDSKQNCLGAKNVRGAYMEKERNRAIEEGRDSPIHDSKQNCDTDFDAGVRFCVDHYERLASCTATHNLDSNLLQAKLIDEKGIVKNHPHLNFCQLLGMSDYITYNLAAAGYNVAKYLVYGPVRDVVPYLIRRAQENTSITGEMSRELGLIKKEMKRRALL